MRQKLTGRGGACHALIRSLEIRFAATMRRQTELDWNCVRPRFEEHPKKLQTLFPMEQTGGEPDGIERDKKTGALIFCDCSPDTPRVCPREKLEGEVRNWGL